MGSRSWLSEEETALVTYWYDRNETVSEAVVEAFTAANIDVFEDSPSLQEQIECDSLDGFHWRSGRALTVTVRLWGYYVIITPETVQLYEIQGPRDRPGQIHE